jgi:hypothetical protein
MPKKRASSPPRRTRPKKASRKSAPKKSKQGKVSIDSYDEWIARQVKGKGLVMKEALPQATQMPKDTYSEWLINQPLKEARKKEEARVADTYSEWMNAQVLKWKEPVKKTTAIQTVQATALAAPDIKSLLPTAREIQITVRGRKSGNTHSAPVWFVFEEGKLFLLPTRGSSSNWFRNLEASPSLEISVEGTKVSAHAKTASDPSLVERVAEKFRAKYGAVDVASYYKRLDACVEVDL